MWRECECEADEEERYNGVLVVGTVWQGPRMMVVNFHTLNVKGCNRVPRPPCRVRINVINLMSTLSKLASARRDQSSRSTG